MTYIDYGRKITVEQSAISALSIYIRQFLLITKLFFLTPSEAIWFYFVLIG